MAAREYWKRAKDRPGLQHRFTMLHLPTVGHERAGVTLAGRSMELAGPGCAAGGVAGVADHLAAGRVSDAFLAVATGHADRTALWHRERAITYSALRRWALAVAYYLLEHPEFHSGDRIALMVENGPEFVAAYYGILTAGGVVVPLPTQVEWNRLERIAELCQINRILSSEQTVKRRVELDPDGCAHLDLNACVPHCVPHSKPLRIEGESLAMIMFTSGSSGDPKGVMLSDGNILANTRSILNYLSIGSDDRALALLPFYHAFGHSIMQTHLLSGAMLVVDGNMAFPGTVVDALERHAATSFSAVPEGYYGLMSYADFANRPLPHLRYMTVAGGALKPDAVTEMARRIAPAQFYVMYGQTEATARLAYLPAELAQLRPDSIGRAIPGVELSLRGEDGREVAAGETGELCARGANIMLGYWKDPQATRATLADGWLHTGDLAICDADGYIYVQARKNDLVKVQGYRVHPREIEEAVAPHFDSFRIIVVPFQQPGGTRLALFAISSRFQEGIVEQIRQVCMRELPRYKVPSHIEVLTQAPLNASMKLDRTALARRAVCHMTPLEEKNSRWRERKSA